MEADVRQTDGKVDLKKRSEQAQESSPQGTIRHRVEAADSPAESASSETPDQVIEEGSEEESGQPERPREIGGPKGPEPTRFGDWEKGGRCIDF